MPTIADSRLWRLVCTAGAVVLAVLFGLGAESQVAHSGGFAGGSIGGVPAAPSADVTVAEADSGDDRVEARQAALGAQLRPAVDSSAPSAARFCSFSAETKVLMANGTTKPISKIEVGDWVLAEHPETGQRGAREVTHLWVHQDTILHLKINGHDVATTEDHPFWNHTDGEWRRADTLASSDFVLTAEGGLLSVDGIDWSSAQLCAQSWLLCCFSPPSCVYGSSSEQVAPRAGAIVDAGKYDYCSGMFRRIRTILAGRLRTNASSTESARTTTRHTRRTLGGHGSGNR